MSFRRNDIVLARVKAPIHIDSILKHGASPRYSIVTRCAVAGVLSDGSLLVYRILRSGDAALEPSRIQATDVLRPLFSSDQ